LSAGWRSLAFLGAVAGLTAVIFAALGSHLGGGIDEASRYRSWQAANAMHGLHALALLGLAALRRQGRSWLWTAAGLLMALGLLLFSGSIYFSILVDGANTGGIAPIGGSTLMLGWLVAAIAAVVDRDV
jgi:uncharacterized membrane protein YgdD (TMEM256/DUF423 family)